MVDSYSFLNMRLAKVPGALGFRDLAKGYHPHRFTYLNYNGKIISKLFWPTKRQNNAKSLISGMMTNVLDRIVFEMRCIIIVVTMLTF